MKRALLLAIATSVVLASHGCSSKGSSSRSTAPEDLDTPSTGDSSDASGPFEPAAHAIDLRRGPSVPDAPDPWSSPVLSEPPDADDDTSQPDDDGNVIADPIPPDSDPPPSEEPAPDSGGAPPPIDMSSAITVGGPPATCEVYELDVPLQMPWMHWPEGETIPYDQNPPAGGQSYEMWAAYRRYDTPVERERWNHNLRHGAIVLIYRPDAPEAVVTALEQALEQIPTPGGKYNADPGCPRMGIMTPDPLLDDTFAVLAWGKMLTSNCVPEVDDIIDFAERHVYEAPEKECWDGAWPTREPCYRFETVRWTQWTYEVPEGEAVTYDAYPPSSGPYYANTLRYGRYDTYVPAPYWTYILAKGGAVVLYRPDADPAMIQQLKTAYDQLSPHWSCSHNLTAMVEDPNLETPYAMVSFNNYMHGECFVGWEMQMFVYSRRGWGPFNSCVDGTFSPTAE